MKILNSGRAIDLQHGSKRMRYRPIMALDNAFLRLDISINQSKGRMDFILPLVKMVPSEDS